MLKYKQIRELRDVVCPIDVPSFRKMGSGSNEDWLVQVVGASGRQRSEIQKEFDRLQSTSENLQKELASCKKEVAKLREELKNKPIIKMTQIFELGERLDLICPIPIVLEESADEVVASFPEIEAFAVGTTESEALINLKSAIVELYLDLYQTPEAKLGPLPLAWRRSLKRVIKPIG